MPKKGSQKDHDDQLLLKYIKDKSKKRGKQLDSPVRVKKARVSKVKEEATQESKITTKSRSRTLVNLIETFSKDQKDAVKDIGFGGLLDLKVQTIPHGILMDLISAFDHQSCTLNISDKVSFVLTKNDVADVFGLPDGPQPINLASSDILKKEWREKFGIKTNLVGIKLNSLENELGKCKTSGDEFKKMFVLFSMSAFLAPTSNAEVDLKLVNAVENVSEIEKTDWCSYILKELACALTPPLPKNVKGCMLFLMVTYFHRFKFGEEELSNELPLIKHWDDHILADRIRTEKSKGKLGTLDLTDSVFPIANHLRTIQCSSGNNEIERKRYLQIELPDHIMTDEEIKRAADDVSYYLF